MCIYLQQTAGVDQEEQQSQEKKSALEPARAAVAQNQSQQKKVDERPSREADQPCIEEEVQPSVSEVWILVLLKRQLNGQVSE